MDAHRQFRTMIIQTENGRHRLKQEYTDRNCEQLDEWIRVSEPPPFGLTLSHPEFRSEIQGEIESFKPECVILDPWNAATHDDRQRDYAETFEALRDLLPKGEDKPALGIVAHTRKPNAGEKRTGGTGLIHILAGSHMLASLPRSIFVMIRGSEDEQGDSIVWCNPKNNNGPLAVRSAWYRRNGCFAPDQDFDWTEFDKPPDKRLIVRLEHLAEVFDKGDLELKDAANLLATVTGITERSAYNALKVDGKFAPHLIRRGRMLGFKP
jgi:hypothetical protein